MESPCCHGLACPIGVSSEERAQNFPSVMAGLGPIGANPEEQARNFPFVMAGLGPATPDFSAPSPISRGWLGQVR
jgi:hypothetical protein